MLYYSNVPNNWFGDQILSFRAKRVNADLYSDLGEKTYFGCDNYVGLTRALVAIFGQHNLACEQPQVGD